MSEREARGGKRGRPDGQMSRVYEGAEVLGELLAAGGSDLAPDDVKELFLEAIAEGAPATEVMPDLFEGEPRFASPEIARRLYGNLFGLWDLLAAGKPPEPGPKAQAPAEPPKPPPAARPEPIEEGPLTDAFVEAAWRHLDDLPEREKRRLRDRWENAQQELIDFVTMEAGESSAMLENADTLAFELWAMLELARPHHPIGRVGIQALQKALAETGPTPEPALERYVDDALAEACLDEQDALGEEESVRIGRLARAVLRSLLKA